MIETLREAETTLRTEILRCVPEAGFIALFGSFARGEVRPFSDIDIVLTRGLPERDPELAYKIAAEGVLLYEQRRYAFAYFKKQAFLYYLDTAYLRSLNRKALHRRLRDGAMGKRNYV